MLYSEAREAAIMAARRENNKHHCVVVTFSMDDNVPVLDYSVMLGNKNGEEPCPKLSLDQACGGSFIMGDADAEPVEYGH